MFLEQSRRCAQLRHGAASRQEPDHGDRFTIPGNSKGSRVDARRAGRGAGRSADHPQPMGTRRASRQPVLVSESSRGPRRSAWRPSGHDPAPSSATEGSRREGDRQALPANEKGASRADRSSRSRIGPEVTSGRRRGSKCRSSTHPAQSSTGSWSLTRSRSRTRPVRRKRVKSAASRRRTPSSSARVRASSVKPDVDTKQKRTSPSAMACW